MKRISLEKRENDITVLLYRLGHWNIEIPLFPEELNQLKKLVNGECESDNYNRKTNFLADSGYFCEMYIPYSYAGDGLTEIRWENPKDKISFTDRIINERDFEWLRHEVLFFGGKNDDTWIRYE